MRDEAALSSRTATIASGVLVLDASLGAGFNVTLNANVTTLTLSNAVASPDITRILVRLAQDATGGRTITLPASVKCIGGTPYVPTPAALSVDLIRLTSFDAGTTWYLESSQQASGGGGGGTPVFNGAAINRNSSSFSIPDSTQTPIAFDAMEFDTSSYWSFSLPTKFTIPAAGYYAVSGSVRLDTASAGSATVSFIKNGSGNWAGNTIINSSSDRSVVSISTVMHFSTGNTVELAVLQDSGAAQNAIALYNQTRFAITFLGT
jgi:hypothetical protein